MVMFIIGYLAAITTVKIFQAVQKRRKETWQERQARHKRLNEEVRGKNRFNENAFDNWEKEVLEDRRRPELMEVQNGRMAEEIKPVLVDRRV